MRSLSYSESTDVIVAVAGLRRTIGEWESARRFVGGSVADLCRKHVAYARELQAYVRASREYGIDIMPTLRGLMAEGRRPIISGRRSIHSRAEKARARFVLDAVRSQGKAG